MKRVRFAEEPEYKLISRSPSPALSDSSVESAILMTPPMNTIYPPFSPVSTKGAVLLHPALSPQSAPTIAFTLGHGFRLAVQAPQVLLESATSPPLPYLTIKSAALPWSVPISARKPDAFVTVGDVFDALRDELRRTVKRKEFEFETQARQEQISFAFYRRTNGDENAYSAGLCRVDFLAGQNYFFGLSATMEGPTVWQLHVGG